MNRDKRNSSLELLRIICIILIISCHYYGHGDYKAFTYDNLTHGVIFIQMISMFGRASCSVFALISGYFLVNSELSIKYYIKIIPLVFELFFYSIAIWIIMYITKSVPISMSQTVRSFFPLFWDNWYIVFYILLYIIAPFLNPGLKAMSVKRYSLLIFILLTIWSIIPTFTSYAWKMSNLDFFVVMYIIGAYIRLHIKDKAKYSNKVNIFICLLSTFIMLISVPAFDLTGKILKANIFIEKAVYLHDYNNIVAVIWAISIFLTFNNILFKNKIINYISASVPGIYLIHENALMRQYIWCTIYPNNKYIDFPYIHAILKISAIFLISLIIDIIRRETAEKKLNSILQKNCPIVVEHIYDMYSNIKLKIKRK